MSDIVERLRMTGDPWPQYADVPLCVEAADEIERLRKTAIETMQEMLRRANEIERLTCFANNLSIDRDKFLADNERLRAFLRKKGYSDEQISVVLEHDWHDKP